MEFIDVLIVCMPLVCKHSHFVPGNNSHGHVRVMVLRVADALFFRLIYLFQPSIPLPTQHAPTCRALRLGLISLNMDPRVILADPLIDHTRFQLNLNIRQLSTLHFTLNALEGHASKLRHNNDFLNMQLRDVSDRLTAKMAEVQAYERVLGRSSHVTVDTPREAQISDSAVDQSRDVAHNMPESDSSHLAMPSSVKDETESKLHHASGRIRALETQVHALQSFIRDNMKGKYRLWRY